MSYNKLKSLVANVEAIETAMKIQVQGRQATAEEKEILSRYSGFGGIKEVLNIGTDKPIGGDMQEPIQRLQELINAYPHFTEPMRHNVIEGIKASVLTAFYTPKFLVDAVVRQIHATFSENGLKMRSFLEPSAGIGGFLPIAMSGTYDYAIEKDLISGMILSLLHENTLTRTAAFETIGEQGFEHTTFDVIASNIPFGNFRVFDAELWKKGVLSNIKSHAPITSKIEELKKQDYAIIDIISEAPVMCLVFVEADYLVAVTYNMFYDFDDVLSFSKFFVKEHFSTK